MRPILSSLFILCFLNISAQDNFGRSEAYRAKVIRDVGYLMHSCNTDRILTPKEIKGDTLIESCEITYESEVEPYVKIRKMHFYAAPMYHQDVYYSEGDTLIYAKETELWITADHRDTIVWNCQYFFEKGELVDYISLGHGRTEMEDWDPEYILKKYTNLLEDE
ncbi:MAG: hypothetical protein Aureis2KO_23430 [Aureisphaera sp.]